MLRNRTVAVVTVAVGALLGALGVSSATAAPPTGTDASEVTHWNQVATSVLGAVPGPNGGAPPAFAINMGMVQGAVYDAVNAIGPKQHRPYLLDRRTGARASIDAAVATAAYDVTSELVSTAPERAPFPGRAGLLSTLSSEYAASLGAVPGGSFKKQGIAVGHAAAAAMLEAREGDGRFGPSAWVPNSAPGHWQPLLSSTGAPLLDPTPWAGDVRPFLIQSSSQFRSVPPPALESAQWAAEFNEVKSLGRADSCDPVCNPDLRRQVVAERTRVQLERGRPPAHHPHRPRRRRQRQAPRAAEHERSADASINCWNDKYHFDFWRPWNAVTRADEDNNPATVADPTWTALITAPYPEWTSGHNCLDAANTTVLRMFFGDDPVGGPFEITSFFVNPGGPAVRTFDTFTQPLTELIEARIWAGLHYRSADVAGQILGRNVATYGAANYLQPVGN